MRVAVVGAGIHGASTARNLAERGHEVALFDQFPPGHNRGSSHGRSRIVRRAYADPYYTECMQEGYPLWRELERASGRELLREVGLLYFGSTGSSDLQSMLSGLQDLKVPHEIFDSKTVVSIFTALDIYHGEIGVFTPEAGWVDADAALAATLQLAMTAGARLELKRVAFDELKEFDRVVICPGAWVKEWWPEAPVRVTLQTVIYLRGDHGGPVWIEDGPNFLYGFPSDGNSFKVAAHRQGPEWEPTRSDRSGPGDDFELAKDLARCRFRIQDAEVVETLGCLYTNTPTEDFLFRQLDQRTVLVSACSGHGFKFGPWIGRTVADLVEGRKTLADFPRFAAK